MKITKEDIENIRLRTELDHLLQKSPDRKGRCPKTFTLNPKVEFEAFSLFENPDYVISSLDWIKNDSDRLNALIELGTKYARKFPSKTPV